MKATWLFISITVSRYRGLTLVDKSVDHGEETLLLEFAEGTKMFVPIAKINLMYGWSLDPAQQRQSLGFPIGNVLLEIVKARKMLLFELFHFQKDFAFAIGQEDGVGRRRRE